MRLTIKEINNRAGELLAFEWLRQCESLLKRRAEIEEWTGQPLRLERLSEMDEQRVRAWLPEYFFTEHAKLNREWFVSSRNAKRIVAFAVSRAILTMHYARDRYPMTVDYFDAQAKHQVLAK